MLDLDEQPTKTKANKNSYIRPFYEDSAFSIWALTYSPLKIITKFDFNFSFEHVLCYKIKKKKKKFELGYKLYFYFIIIS
jgi:hypothetical protein